MAANLSGSAGGWWGAGGTFLQRNNKSSFGQAQYQQVDKIINTLNS